MIGPRYATVFFIVEPEIPVYDRDNGSINISGLVINSDGTVDMDGIVQSDGTLLIDYIPEDLA